MKDWGLSFQNRKSAKIFYHILKEGFAREGSQESQKSEDLLGKRDEMWSDEEDEARDASEEGNKAVGDNDYFIMNLI